MSANRCQEWDADLADAIVARHANRDGALLPILHDLQTTFGYIAPDAVSLVSARLNISRADVHGVVTFYHDFRTAPVTKPVLKLCHAEACQARGVGAIVLQAEADRRVIVEPVYCLGLCASGPAVMVGEKVYARVDRDALDLIIEEITA